MTSSYIIDNLKQQLFNALKLANYEVDYDALVIEINQQKSNFGDYSSPIILQLAKKYNKNPKIIAQEVVSQIKYGDLISEVNILGSGFINFNVNINAFCPLLNKIITDKAEYGKLDNNGIRFNVEYVSANPTGLLHLGHARNAAIGSTFSNILKHQGYQVTQEYYINDAGNQINILANSIFVRYQNLCGASLEMPEESYRGSEIIAAAEAFKQQFGNEFYQKELNGDLLQTLRQFGIKFMLDQIKLDLKNFGVTMDIWFSEDSLYHTNAIKLVLEKLAKSSNSYEKDGAVWLQSTKFGDDKDRVLVKSDGTYTYLLPDLTYHDIKFQKSDKVVNVWGADHSGYIMRMKSGLTALGHNGQNLSILPTQMVRVVSNGKEQKMSKRAGTSITLRDLLEQIGKDALRYFMVSRTSESHLDIDINVVTSKNQDNPLFYLQYAHARINQILAQRPKFKVANNIDLLVSAKEKELLIILDEYNLVLRKVVEKQQSHLLANYLQKLAKSFHSYYNEYKIINLKNEQLVDQRLTLCLAVKTILFNGLKLIGVNAPDKM